MTLEEIKAEIKRFKANAEVEADLERENEWNIGYQDGKYRAYENCLDLLDKLDGVLNLLTYVEEPSPITEDEVKNHVLGLHNYCISKTDCKDCLFKGREGCDFVDNCMIPSQWNIPQHWRDEKDDSRRID